MGNLRAESSGILRQLVAGCLAWQRDGLREPKSVADATGGCREESDPLAEFLHECCVVLPEAWVATKALRTAYESFCQAQGVRPLLGREFTDALGRHGANRKRTKFSRGWTGIGLVTEVTE